MDPQSSRFGLRRARTDEAIVAEWQRASTELASTIRAHLPVGGFCPICRWPGGRPVPAPCDVTVESRQALRDLCDEPRAEDLR